MSRTKIISLLLVNWRGVFYERYLLDSNVTALEGGNGAGKTTVMIAAYVALLPDLSRLRFTNVGESGAKGSDRGIWGRLGEAARPSYTALEIRRADGSRLIAGVRLTKKGEPSVEATPFVIESLRDDVRLQELFLVQDGEDEHVPEITELRQAATEAGATLQVFRAVKEYFSALFERGITPMRLVGEEDRNKFNEMLRTSMTGGISKTLTQELRSFVLKKESGLADTLSLMRANLDACRRSRGEVGDARRLQREISGVYDAGTAFFSTQVLAVRARAHQRRESLAKAKENLSAVARGHVELESAVAAHKARQEQVQARQRDARLALEHAKLEEERRRKAELLRQELSERDEELLELRKNAELAKHVMEACDEERTAWQTARDSAQEAYDRAAGGLAKLQDGLDELHRRARDYRQLHRSLQQAREALHAPELGLGDCAVALARLKVESQELDLERATLERETQSLAVRRDEYQRASSALAELAELVETEQHESTSPHQRARLLLAELDRREATQGRLADLEQEGRDLEGKIARQESARERAEKLGIATGKLGAADALAARLEQVEALWGEDEERARFYDGLAARHERDLASMTLETEALELRSARYAVASKAAEHLSSALKVAAEGFRSVQDLEAAEAALSDRHSAHVQSRIGLERAREAALQLVSDLESTGGSLSSELLRVRDILGGELVAGRFEELAASDAARLEASLGPLSQAIIVDDVEAAAKVLAEAPEPPNQSVWLVAAGTPLESVASDTSLQASCVVVVDGLATRVSPVPRNPTLGRAARVEAIERARARATELREDLEASAREKLQLAALHRDFGVLRDSLDVYLAGDPSPLREELAKKGTSLQSEVADARTQASDARERATGLRGEVDALRSILSEGALLEPPEFRTRRDAIDEQITRATHTSGLLVAAQGPRETVAVLLDVLRNEPPKASDVSDAQERIKSLDQRRDELFAVRDLLNEAMANRHASEWHDAEELLASRTSLVPALEEQHLQAREATAEAARSVANAEQEWAGATKVWQAADARCAASMAMRERLALDLSELGPDREAGEDTSGQVKRRLLSLDKELLEAVESGARDRERLSRSEHRLAEARAAVKNEILASEPSQVSWNELRDACDEAGLLSGILMDGEGARRARSAEQLVTQAAGKRDLLVDRLSQARGGEELLSLVQGLPSGVEIGGESEQLRVWLSLREWMRQRVPAQISQEADPLRALERLREHLSGLESRLSNQEGDLRSASEDVARGVDVQLRRARWQVQRLNEHLENIHFGTISGIRVQMSRVERMEQILRALRDGQAQELLFQASLPFEDALSEIFSRYGGGRGGGQRLLDYREYLELGVEIRRQSGDRWEEASPTRLSTGEAIGVGAALMMVVLTEWERDANLLRSQKLGGSLRFLFLDEANRLSKDNLGVLFELCRNLELQLLIAAPEVAHAGDNTTYRLVRRALKGGGEEVLVSGRRAVVENEAGSSETKDESSEEF